MINSKASIARRYFTLIELLVVISIIAILMTLLLPSLSKAKHRAKAIACAGMMKQRALWGQFYANDYQVILPIASRPGHQKGLWYYQMYEYSNMKKKSFEKHALSCPADTNPGGPFTGWVRYVDPQISLLYNNWFGMFFGAGFTCKTPEYVIKVSSVKKPSICGQMIEGNMPATEVASYCMPWLVGWGMPTWKVRYRHNNRTYITYLDGHVGGLTDLEIKAIPNSWKTLTQGK